MYSIQTLNSILLEPTSYCNARCPQCDRFDDKNNLIVPLRHLDVATLERSLDIASMPALEKVMLEGNCGDVLSHNDPMALVRLFRGVRMVELVTNGSVRGEDFYRELAQHPNTHLVFSIDGLEDTNHMYRQECDFDRIMANAEAYIRAGGKAFWKFIVFRHNEHQVEQARLRSERMGFHGFWTLVSDRSWHKGGRFPVYNRGVYQFDLERASTLDNTSSDSEFINMSKHVAELYRKRTTISHCPWAQQRQVFIDHLGHVVPCCMVSADMWSRGFNTPFMDRLLPDRGTINLNQHTLEQVFRSEFYQRALPESLATRPMPACLCNCWDHHGEPIDTYHGMRGGSGEQS